MGHVNTARARSAMVVIVALFLGTIGFPAQRAAAATITFNVQARLSEHHGTSNTDAINCIKYSPAGTATSSAWVSAGATALTAHGYPAGSNCPATLSTTRQSAIGVTPAATTSATDGVPFLLSSITHYNNPISGGVASRYTGTLSLLLSGFDNSPTVDYAWTMWKPRTRSPPVTFPTDPIRADARIRRRSAARYPHRS